MLVSKSLYRKETNRYLTISIIKQLILSLFFAALTGVSSKIRFFLPFTPVPITGQVFMVLLSGITLGAEFGSLSQLFYVFLGISGIPWFALGSLFGPTGGYLIGFIIAPYIVGTITRKNISLIPIAMISGIAVIYLFGALQFSLILKTSFIKTIKLAVLPFIPVDILKSGIIILIIPFYEKIKSYL